MPRGRRPNGVRDKKIHDRLVTLWQVGFFSHTPLMAKSISKTVSATRKYISGANTVPKSVVNLYNLDTEDFWNTLEDVKESTIQALDPSIHHPELSPYKDEIFNSVLWTIRCKTHYRTTKALNDHKRWYLNYLQVLKMARMGITPSTTNDQRIYDFFKYNNSHYNLLSPQKQSRIDEYTSILKKNR